MSAWLLLATLLPMLVVKSVHCHGLSHTSTGQTIRGDVHDHHGAYAHFYVADTACPICHMALPLCMEAGEQSFHCVVACGFLEYQAPEESKAVGQPVAVNRLRAPPVPAA